jgi:hypothetical protein
MKHHKLLTLMPAVLIALSTIIVNAPPVTAHGNGGPDFNTWERGYLTRDYFGYKNYIPVCLEASVYGPQWDIVSHPNHARIADAIIKWVAIGGELNYWASNTNCATWRASGEPFLSIRKLDQSQLGFTDGAGTLCIEAWGLSCSKEVRIAYDSVLPTGKSWYTGTGTVPSNQYDFLSVMIHELGHTMRCGPESTHTADVMYGTLSTGPDQARTLTANDKECYTHYYGTTH